MNLKEALLKFREGKRRGYSSSDLEVISEVVRKLSIEDNFFIKKDYVTDAHDRVHIHPTMVVATRAFPGSTNRGLKPYPDMPHFRKLSGWK